MFVGDYKIRKQYEKKVEKNSEATDLAEFWIDLIKFQADFKALKTAEAMFNKALDAKFYDTVKFYNLAYNFLDSCQRLEHLKPQLLEAKQAYLKG